jgi:hypothetical protein
MGPVVRAGDKIVYDKKDQFIVFSGGYNTISGQAHGRSDTWIYCPIVHGASPPCSTGSAWYEITPDVDNTLCNTAPNCAPPRSNYTNLAYNANDGLVYHQDGNDIGLFVTSDPFSGSTYVFNPTPNTIIAPGGASIPSQQWYILASCPNNPCLGTTDAPLYPGATTPNPETNSMVLGIDITHNILVCKTGQPSGSDSTTRIWQLSLGSVVQPKTNSKISGKAKLSGTGEVH